MLLWQGVCLLCRVCHLLLFSYLKLSTIYIVVQNGDVQKFSRSTRKYPTYVTRFFAFFELRIFLNLENLKPNDLNFFYFTSSSFFYFIFCSIVLTSCAFIHTINLSLLLLFFFMSKSEFTFEFKI